MLLLFFLVNILFMTVVHRIRVLPQDQ